jgi:lysine-specific histone demethylase 1
VLWLSGERCKVKGGYSLVESFDAYEIVCLRLSEAYLWVYVSGVEADVATERRADPSALLCKQLGLELTTLRGDCPLYDSVTGQKVPADIDAALEAEYNSLLDDTVMLVAQNGDAAMRLSLEEGLEQSLKRRRSGRSSQATDIDGNVGASKDEKSEEKVSSVEALKKGEAGTMPTTGDVISETLTASDPSDKLTIAELASNENTLMSLDRCMSKIGLTSNQVDNSSGQNLTELERRIMDWHFANLEYGCAAELKEVSLPYWNQDDVYGGFGGPHCMIKGGYSQAIEALSDGLNFQFGKVVKEICYSSGEGKVKGVVKRDVKVVTEEGEEFKGDAVLVTIPLGCLKEETVRFKPRLPDWKVASIKRLGFGILNKVVMEFSVPFWDESVDYFGAAAESTELRGRCFMFWNLKRTSGYPILVALVVGKAAYEGERQDSEELVEHAVEILRKLFGVDAVPKPTASVVTNWGADPFSRGAYSYVALGASGEDYDILARPVENCVFFAGEATCKEHPDTVGGAMMSGMREAVRMSDILENRGDSTAEAEAMAAAQRQSDSERNEVRCCWVLVVV